ncbi:MAG: ATP-binding protein [Acidimicrobiia bacterium]
MSAEHDSAVPPVEKTLVRVVLLMRLLAWVWMMLLVVTTAVADTGADGLILTVTAIVGTAGSVLLLVAVLQGFLGRVWYMVLDGLIAGFLLTTGWLAGAQDFFAGGYPMSWVFVVAFTTGLAWTLSLSLVFTLWFAALHVIMGLDAVRVVGSIQFVVVAIIVGWAFDSLRERESLRLAAEADRAEAENQLAEQREAAVVLRQRTQIARELHDSVLQTLKLISSSADDADHVRYLTRVQERDLRRTINEYRSPHEDSFRARLLDVRAAVEDRYRVEIEQVIRDDTEMTPELAELIEAAKEAMANAARHSGSPTIDLFAEVKKTGVTVNVRDRGSGFDAAKTTSGGVADSIVRRMEDVGGSAHIKSAPESGTDVTLYLPINE